MAEIPESPKVLKESRRKLAKFAKDFYDFGSSVFKFGPLVSWLQRRLGKPPSQFAIEIFVAISLSASYFFLIAPQVEAPRSSDGNETNAYLFRYLSHHPYAPHTDLQSTFTAWGARLAGPIISGWVMIMHWPYQRNFLSRAATAIISFLTVIDFIPEISPLASITRPGFFFYI
jgi:hypothetical protein